MAANEAPETAKPVASAVAVPSAPAVAEPAPSPDQAISITDFCRERSHGDKRVELLSGFHHHETAGNRTRDTRKNYAARYVAFANLPA